MNGYNGGGYPPRPPGGGYSPAAPFGDGRFRPPPPNMPNFPPPGSSNSGGGPAFPPFPPGPTGFGMPPARPPFPPSPYDEYNPSGPSALNAPPKFPPFEPNRKPAIDTDVYDPYQPQSSGYTPMHGAGPLSARPPVTRPRSAAPISAGPRSAYFSKPPTPFAARRAAKEPQQPDLPLLTAPTTAHVGHYTAMIYSLPPSHLPITKYVTVNAGDAVDLHRALCQTGKSSSVWYAEGSNQGGEGWGAAVEWNLDTGISGQKLRTCVGMTDSLGTELGAILKAVEGFYEQLKQSIRSNKPMSHEFILFCSSPAALVSIDTSARPEAIEFERLWREICTDFLHARMTLVRVAPSSDVEGHMLARKISDVAARNSFTKRRKERTIEDIYNRPGGDEPAPGASTVGGAWQRGDADPSHRKVPFDRPEPPVSPKPESKMRSRSRSTSRSRSRSRSPTPERNERSRSPLPAAPAPVSVQAPPEPEDEPLQPRSGALCVTHFPDSISAKDLGILFAQFGDIQSVDIFSIPTVKSRFAFVAYAEPEVSCPAAVQALHRQPINLDTSFARENAQDLVNWKGFTGVLTIEESDSDRLIPLGVSKYFPNLPDYATSVRGRGSTDLGKRDRNGKQTTNSPSPKKRRTLGLPSDLAEPNSVAAWQADSGAYPPTPLTGGPRGHLSPALLSAPTASFSEPQTPVTLSAKTLDAQLNLVHNVFVKHDTSNWIAHTCLIATDLDQARRRLQDDLYATDDASLAARDLEATLSSRGFTIARMDAFVVKVLKVLDGIASADEAEANVAGGVGTAAPASKHEDVSALKTQLDAALRNYPPQTRDAMAAAATVLEYLGRGKEEQERKRLEVERRVGVLGEMVKIGEQVSKVVSHLLSES